MILLPLFSLSMLLVGFALSSWLWARDARNETEWTAVGPLEALASSLLLTLFAINTVNWGLAAVHGITPLLLTLSALLLALLSAAFLAFERRRKGAVWGVVSAIARTQIDLRLAPLVAVVLPITLWLGFMAWRGSLTPVLSHDAYSYHLPRAVDIVQNGTWRYLPVEDFRLSWFPSNYELMLADFILLTGRADSTNFLSLFHYVAGFLLCAAYGERRWGAGAKGLLPALVWAASPIVLLHAGAQKNDLLTMVYTLGVALFGARWVVRGGTAPLVLTLLSAALGVGTKWIGAAAAPAFVLAFLPFGLVARVKTTFSSFRSVAALLGGSLVVLYLGGIVPYVAHLVHLDDTAAAGFSFDDLWAMNIAPRFGSISNYWKFATLLFLRPFSNPTNVWVPWEGKYWFWPRFEIYFGDFGLLFSCLLCLVPIAMVAARRFPVRGDDLVRRERLASSLFLLVVVATVVSMYFRTDGFFAGYPRFLLFLPLLVVDAGLLPLIDMFGRERRGELYASLALGVVAIVFSVEGGRMALWDNFAPLDYVLFLAGHPEYRRPYFSGNAGRSEQLAREAASLDDRVAVDGGFGAWVYAAYDDDLRRRVDVLPLDAAGREKILEKADVIVVDRYWAVCWGAPELKDFSQVAALSNHGTMTKTDIERVDALKRDSRFELVYDSPNVGQFVFRRLAR